MAKIKRITALAVCAALMTTHMAAGVSASRQVEYLSRGGYAVKANDGIFLSWRLLGTEEQSITFDIYRDDELILSDYDRTNYTDKNGSTENRYRVVPHGSAGDPNDVIDPDSKPYFDIPLDKPNDGVTPDGESYTYGVYDVSVADVDNDGAYEYIINWDPDNRKDNETVGYTGNVYIDCYKQNGKKLWRIDMGKNIRAGSHYTQFIAYDFDGDGKAELAMRTAPGSKDSTGAYVSEKGAPINGRSLSWNDEYTGERFNNESDLRNETGRIIKGPDWLTMFNGETGEAMQTVNFYPQRGNVSSWGDDYGNRSERYLGGVAYLDGEHPSLIMSRGYYKRAAMAAYDWDGKSFSIRWTRDDTSKGKNLYGNGNHQLTVCDADNDGKDEIVFGSTVVDDDGSILNSTDHGHGDALHASDFDNDGEQEIFSVHEEPEGYMSYGAELRKAKNARILAAKGASGDVERGLIGNFDDNVGTSEWMSSADDNIYDVNRRIIGKREGRINPTFLVWWDGDLGRELLYRNLVISYDTETSSQTRHEQFPDILSIGKDGPALSADLFGDWREEICYPTADNTALRVFMTTIPTEYKIPTLMHDTQYRTAIAWQNVGYNQPPHPKFYVGKAALDASGKYLAPAAGFDTVTMVGDKPDILAPEPKLTVGAVEWNNDSVVVSVNISGGSADILATIGVYDSSGALKIADTVFKRINSAESIILSFTADETDTVKIFIWNNDQKPYCDVIER